MNKKQKIIAGVVTGVAVVGLGTGYHLMNTPKALFLSRIKASSELKKASQDFTFSLNSNVAAAQGLDGFELKGEANIDGDNSDITLSASGAEMPFLKFKNFHIITKGEDVFISAESFASYYAQTYGMTIKEDLSDKYINFNEFSPDQPTYQPNSKLQEEINNALGKYFVKLEDSHFKKKDDDVTLSLDKKDLKNVITIILDTTIESKHYKEDKELLKEAKKQLDSGFEQFMKDSKLNLMVTQGKVAGNTKISVKYHSDGWGDFNADFSTKIKDYKAPKKLGEVVGSDYIEEVLAKETAAYFEEHGFDFDNPETTEENQ